MATDTTLSAARSGTLEARGFRALRVSGFWSPRTVRPGRSCGTVDSTGVLPPDPTALSGICARCIPVASSGPSVQWHRHSCLCAFAEPGTRPIADADSSLACISFELTPFACPEPRRALTHPRKRSSTELRTVQWHRHSCLCAFAEPGTQPTAYADASLARISSELTPFACPEPRRAQPHPRKPFLVTRHLELKF
jgi:uncharacterized Zn-finger protein